jgi:hypothetical protein
MNEMKLNLLEAYAISNVSVVKKRRENKLKLM